MTTCQITGCLFMCEELCRQRETVLAEHPELRTLRSVLAGPYRLPGASAATLNTLQQTQQIMSWFASSTPPTGPPHSFTHHRLLRLMRLNQPFLQIQHAGAAIKATDGRMRVQALNVLAWLVNPESPMPEPTPVWSLMAEGRPLPIPQHTCLANPNLEQRVTMPEVKAPFSPTEAEVKMLKLLRGLNLENEDFPPKILLMGVKPCSEPTCPIHSEPTEPSPSH